MPSHGLAQNAQSHFDRSLSRERCAVESSWFLSCSMCQNKSAEISWDELRSVRRMSLVSVPWVNDSTSSLLLWREVYDLSKIWRQKQKTHCIRTKWKGPHDGPHHGMMERGFEREACSPSQRRVKNEQRK
jgi:hypothetical protein